MSGSDDDLVEEPENEQQDSALEAAMDMEEDREEFLVPRAKNGRLDWLAYIRTTWPILIGIVGFVWWVSGRLQTPEQKAEQTRLLLRPMELKIERLIADHGKLDGLMRGHMVLGGHAVAEQRLKTLEGSIQKLEQTTDRMEHRLDEIKDLIRNGNQ